MFTNIMGMQFFFEGKNHVNVNIFLFNLVTRDSMDKHHFDYSSTI